MIKISRVAQWLMLSAASLKVTGLNPDPADFMSKFSTDCQLHMI